MLRLLTFLLLGSFNQKGLRVEAQQVVAVGLAEDPSIFSIRILSLILGQSILVEELEEVVVEELEVRVRFV